MYCGEALCIIAFLILWRKAKDDMRDRAEAKEINQTERALLMAGDEPPAEPSNCTQLVCVFLELLTNLSQGQHRFCFYLLLPWIL